MNPKRWPTPGEATTDVGYILAFPFIAAITIGQNTEGPGRTAVVGMAAFVVCLLTVASEAPYVKDAAWFGWLKLVVAVSAAGWAVSALSMPLQLIAALALVLTSAALRWFGPGGELARMRATRSS